MAGQDVWHGYCYYRPSLYRTAVKRFASLLSKEKIMLYWAAVFLIIALIAGVFGFGGVMAGAAGIAKVLFFVFLVLFVISLIMGRRPIA
jgi:uncharacterized membrane protein YtjA (UPF0391 family)